MIRVLLVDDQMLVREGIKSLLSLSDAVAVVAEACNGEEALTTLTSTDVDVVLMDIRMPVMDGIAAVAALQAQGNDTPVLMLTTFDEHQLVMQAVEAGAKGYLLKDLSLERLLEAIEAVHQGKTMVQPSITESMLKGLQQHQTQHNGDFQGYEQPETLSSKEIQVLRLMAAGCSNKEIAQLVHRSEGTVKNQVSSILAKLGVRDRTRAVLKALELGLI